MNLSSINTSGFKGVYFNKEKQKWQVAIGGPGNRIYIGRFNDPVDAARAYDAAAIKHYGEFAKTNQMLGTLNPAKQ